MNKKQFLSKMIAVCSCVLVGISSITATAAGTYNIANDTWNFCNSNSSFGNTYVLTEQDSAALRKKLSNVERRQANELIKNQFMGSCYGMAVTSILASQGLIDYDVYTEKADSLHSMSGIEEWWDEKQSDEILSLINFYLCLQFTEEVRQYTAYSMLEQTDADRLQQIIENAEQGIPTLVGYFGKTNNITGNRYGHAVVAYDVEYGLFDERYYDYQGNLKGAMYTGRIDAYNCNNPNQCSYIYFNEDYTWSTDKCDSNSGGNISIVISDIDLLNNKGLFNGTKNYSNSRDFLSLLDVKSLQQNRTLQRISFDNGSWTPIDSVDGQINEFPVFLGDASQIGSKMYVLKDAESGYVLSTDGMGTMSAQMNYQNSLLMADVDDGDQIVFDPSGYIEMKGNNTDYDFEMTFNDGYYDGNWFNISVDGKANSSSLMKTNNGFILKADRLNGTVVTVDDGKNLIRHVINTNTYTDSVLIFENENQKIGFAADLDNNGSYETVLHDIADGDIRNDGVLNIADVVLLQKWLLKSPDAVIDNWELADMNYDNKLDVFDLCLMKRALLSMENEAPPPFDEEKYSFQEMFGTDIDETYENITATAMESVYSSDTSEIICELKNSNSGKGFYFFQIPFLEKYENGNWKQLYNGDPAIYYTYDAADAYKLCCFADHFSTSVKIQTKNLTPGLTEGHYRFKIYTAKNILYAEFDVAD